MAGRFKYDGLHRPITTTSDENGSQGLHKTTWSCSVYIVVILVSMSSTFGLDTLWLTSSRSTNHIPDKANLKNYLVGFFIFGNLGALLYLFVYTCFAHRRHCTEVVTIYVCLLLGLVSSAIIAVFWEEQAGLWYNSHGLLYMGSAMGLSLIACLSTITIVPFATSLKPIYISAVFMGETLTRLLSHLIAIGEGISEPPACRIKTPTNRSWILLRGWRARHRPSTTQSPVIPPPLRFDESIFFFAVTGVLFLSLFSFLVLRCIPAVRFEYEKVQIDSMDDACESTQTSSILTRSDHGDCIPMSHLEGYASTSNHIYQQEDISSVRNTSNKNMVKNPHPGYQLHKDTRWNPKTTIAVKGGHKIGSPEKQHKTTPRRSIKHYPGLQIPKLTLKRNYQNQEAKSPYQPPSLCLMLTLTFWACLVMSGPLSPTKAYACIPRGNRAFQSGTILSQLAGIVAVFCSIKVNPYSRITMVTAFTSLATILLTYFVALISFSHESESREDSPLFMNTGELLTTIAWSSVSGLFMFTRAMVAILLRQHNKHMLIWYSAISLLGTSLGSLFMLDNINICRIYRDFERLYCQSSS